MDSNNWLKQLMMLGVGTTSLVAEKVRQVSDELVRDGKLNPEQARVFVDDMMQQLKSDQGNFEVRSGSCGMHGAGFTRQSEMDELGVGLTLRAA